MHTIYLVPPSNLTLGNQTQHSHGPRRSQIRPKRLKTRPQSRATYPFLHRLLTITTHVRPSSYLSQHSNRPSASRLRLAHGGPALLDRRRTQLGSTSLSHSSSESYFSRCAPRRSVGLRPRYWALSMLLKDSTSSKGVVTRPEFFWSTCACPYAA